jgi:hypothetical protein
MGRSPLTSFGGYVGGAREADCQAIGGKPGFVQLRRALNAKCFRKPCPFANLRATDADGKVKRPIRRA